MFRDHFSVQAELYARCRPTYPPELFEFILAHLPERKLCWDCATGSGQAACTLAEHFEAVLATDASPQQLERAQPHPRVTYRRALASESGLADQSVDLVTAATALHWFDLEPFYAEARRVGKPHALLAAWSYAPKVHVTPELDALLDEFSQEYLASWWAPEIAYPVQGYRTLPFPFEEIETPTVEARMEWTLDQLLGYIFTWSAVQAHLRERGVNPLDALVPDLERAWGDRAQPRLVRWPMSFRLGRLQSPARVK